MTFRNGKDLQYVGVSKSHMSRRGIRLLSSHAKKRKTGLKGSPPARRLDWSEASKGDLSQLYLDQALLLLEADVVSLSLPSLVDKSV
jgi:hypothetical protein